MTGSGQLTFVVAIDMKAKQIVQDYLLKDQEEKQVVATEPVPTEKAAVDAAPEPPVTEPAVESTETPAATSVAKLTQHPDTEESDGETMKRRKNLRIMLETAPGDYRFPTTNQSRHCFTRYVEYQRCVAAKGEDASECDKFAKYYRSLCPGEWIDKWNEHRENGTFPGPL
ncbi:cytochrome c oxidase subunit 6B-1-like protein [Tanacetum coccineum]